MKPIRIVASALASLALAAAAPAVDWTRKVSQTPAGAFVLGNPAAKTRLIEYVSYTCPHCAHFTNEAAAPLRTGYVAKGAAAIEIRHAVRDPMDLAATLLARCTGPGRFFAAHERLFATQEQWFAKGAEYWQGHEDALKAATAPTRLKMIAKGAELPAIVGLTDAQASACLADAAQEKLVLAMTDEAWSKRKIPGTPFFLVNGKPVADTTSWSALEPHLKP